MSREFIVFIGVVVGIPFFLYLGRRRLDDDDQGEDQAGERGEE